MNSELNIGDFVYSQEYSRFGVISKIIIDNDKGYKKENPGYNIADNLGNDIVFGVRRSRQAENGAMIGIVKIADGWASVIDEHNKNREGSR